MRFGEDVPLEVQEETIQLSLGCSTIKVLTASVQQCADETDSEGVRALIRAVCLWFRDQLIDSASSEVRRIT